MDEAAKAEILDLFQAMFDHLGWGTEALSNLR